MAEATKEGWFWWHERALLDAPALSFTWPEGSADYREHTFSQNTLTQLRCRAYKNPSWTDDDGREWKVFYLDWAPGRVSGNLVGGHRPEVCLGSSGWKLIRMLPPVNVGPGVMHFNHYLFDRGGRMVNVFQGLWEPRVSPVGQRLLGEDHIPTRFKNALAGRRHLGGVVLEIALAGAHTPEEAVSALEKEVQRIVRVESGGR